jgi:tRNA pseudouridine38-40 synthase
MTAAAVSWLGEHDFSSFRAAGCQARSPNRRLVAVRIAQRPHGGGTLVTCEFTANAFLQHMVRNLVGTLVAIGHGELPAAAAAEILARRDRTQAGVSAPPSGLALVEVLYAREHELPSFPDEA